jgi:hypothetical protein
MKRFLVIFLCMFLLTGLTGCGESTESQDSREENMFVYIQKPNLSDPYAVVYQRDTKVMYVVSGGAYNCGTFTMLVNPDGSPMLYEKESEE